MFRRLWCPMGADPFHNWEKWRNKRPILGDDSNFDVRRCQDCGYKQERWIR